MFFSLTNRRPMNDNSDPNMEEIPKAPEVVPPSSLEAYGPAQSRYHNASQHWYTPIQTQGQGQTSYPQPSTKQSKSSFIKGLLLGLLCATIAIGAALGGGLGATLSSCKSQIKNLQDSSSPSSSSSTTPSSPSRTTTPSSTSSAGAEDYTALPPLSISTLHSTCDPSDTPTNTWGATFTPICGRDIISGWPAVEGGVIIDIMGLTAYSFLDCMNACSGFNWGAKKAGEVTRCRAVVFGVDMRNATAGLGANCWLKNGTLENKLDGLAKPIAMAALWVRGGPM